ncbi:unnamed protein product [Mesocestoides corti]|uniref:Uncharacterized protein n=1 Tax=Mesocestoides corti TaxID=53468 RepID=A0A0R3UCN4_MESCO|nr:unnamed protein product [Mesocestoides corti]
MVTTKLFGVRQRMRGARPSLTVAPRSLSTIGRQLVHYSCRYGGAVC